MRFLLSLLLLASFTLSAQAANKSNTVVMRPGDVIYARFEPNGKKIKLAGFSKEKDDRAQVIFTATRDKDTHEVKLQVENKFPDDFDYDVSIHSLRMDRVAALPSCSVVGGKLGFETFPPQSDELFLSGFRLER